MAFERGNLDLELVTPQAVTDASRRARVISGSSGGDRTIGPPASNALREPVSRGTEVFVYPNWRAEEPPTLHYAWGTLPSGRSRAMFRCGSSPGARENQGIERLGLTAKAGREGLRRLAIG